MRIGSSKGVLVLDLGGVELGLDKARDVGERAGAVERHHRGELFDGVGLELDTYFRIPADSS